MAPSARRSASQLPLAQKPSEHSSSVWHLGPAHTPFVHVPVAQSAGSEQTSPTPSGKQADALQMWSKPDVAQQLPKAHSLAALHELPLAPHACLQALCPSAPQHARDWHSAFCEHGWSLARFGLRTHAPSLQELPSRHPFSLVQAL
jgi:hypothetical protein